MRILFPEAPAAVAEALLLPGEGKERLSQLAQLCFEATGQEPTMFDLGLEALVAAWEADPADGEAARLALLAMARKPRALPGLAPDLEAVAKAWRQPENRRYLDRLRARGDVGALLDFLRAQGKKEPGNPFWLREFLEEATVAGEFAAAQAQLDARGSSLPAWARDRVRGDLALLGGDPAGAMAMFEASLLARPMPTTLARLGECAFRLDDVELAARRWAELAELQPWRVGWLLRLHDLLCGPPGRRASLPGSVLAMIVSQGGPDMLDRCLERLFAQPDPLLAALVCDNGDASVATALDAWLGRIGPERLQVLRLPVAVGVPAARNWMRRLDSVAAADQVLLLDDRALLPSGWRESFGAAVALRPDAAFHALAATDEGRPGWLAGLGGGILPEVGLTPEGQAATPPAPRFVLDEPWRREPDFGQFDGARPCLAAPGACKLVAGELLRGAPDFDLRFSPTGCEDADRDLAQALAGRVGSCVGLARVALQTGPHPARDAGILAANLHKLQKKIDAAQTLALLERGRAAARADLEGKLARLAQR